MLTCRLCLLSDDNVKMRKKGFNDRAHHRGGVIALTRGKLGISSAHKSEGDGIQNESAFHCSLVLLYVINVSGAHV